MSEASNTGILEYYAIGMPYGGIEKVKGRRMKRLTIED